MSMSQSRPVSCLNEMLELPIHRDVQGGEVAQGAFCFNSGTFLLHGHALDDLLHTLNVFPHFRRTRYIHIQEHETSALEPALMLLLHFCPSPVQGLSSLDRHRAKAGFRAGLLAATLPYPKCLMRKMRPSAALKYERKCTSIALFILFLRKEGEGRAGRRARWCSCASWLRMGIGVDGTILPLMLLSCSITDPACEASWSTASTQKYSCRTGLYNSHGMCVTGDAWATGLAQNPG